MPTSKSRTARYNQVSRNVKFLWYKQNSALPTFVVHASGKSSPDALYNLYNLYPSPFSISGVCTARNSPACVQQWFQTIGCVLQADAFPAAGGESVRGVSGTLQVLQPWEVDCRTSGSCEKLNSTLQVPKKGRCKLPLTVSGFGFTLAMYPTRYLLSLFTMTVFCFKVFYI